MSFAVIYHHQNRIMRHFHVAGATSPAQALPLASVGVCPSMVFRYLERRGVIRRTDSAHFFLDEGAEQLFRRRRFRFTVIALAVGVLVMLIAVIGAIVTTV
jgi:hypothetical protein